MRRGVLLMKEYQVVWETTIYAKSAVDAAGKAMGIYFDKGHATTVFYVTDKPVAITKNNGFTIVDIHISTAEDF